MTRGKTTAVEVRKAIWRMRARKSPVKNISDLLNIPLSTVYQVLSQGSRGKWVKRRGRPPLYTRFSHRVAVVTTRNPTWGVFRISRVFGFRTSPTTVWSILRRTSWRRIRPKRQQGLKQRHLVTPRKFGVWFLSNKVDLPRVIWTDEKSSPLMVLASMGPDGHDHGPPIRNWLAALGRGE